MEKRSLICLAAIALIIGGIATYALTRPATPGKSFDRAHISELTKTGTYEEHKTYYDIVARFPSQTPFIENMGTTTDQAVVKKVREIVDAQVAQFKADGNFDHLTHDDIQMLGLDQRKESLDIEYLVSSSPRTISYIFSISEDTLGAHPNLFFKTITFDSETAQVVALKDLFKSGAPYLDRLSKAARAGLPAVIGQYVDERMLDDGTTADEKNFENFFLDNANLDILFPPYQVAAYAAGPQTLQLPLSTFSDILNPAYR